MNEIERLVRREVERRRTFAIISHPDAGKTTLTEKLLLYGGCLDVAGVIRGRKSQRAVTSDWMELERQRGISVSSTVLTFEYDGYQVNLLDTPGHHDFSEDTYRTLMAADCAVMVIDLAKGVEAQTEKLFRVCALRKIPVITFVNKVDRPGQEPLAILTEIETKLGIEAVPHNWPLGTGSRLSRRRRPGRRTRLTSSTSGDGERRIQFRSLPLESVDRTRHGPAGARAVEGRGGTAARRRRGVRPRAVPGRKDVARLLRQRLDELWRRALPARLSGPLPARRRPAERSGPDPADAPGVRRLRVQDSGQPRSAASRPRGLSAGLLGPFRARDGGAASANRQATASCAAPTASSARSAKRWTRPFPATSSAW